MTIVNIKPRWHNGEWNHLNIWFHRSYKEAKGFGWSTPQLLERREVGRWLVAPTPPYTHLQFYASLGWLVTLCGWCQRQKVLDIFLNDFAWVNTFTFHVIVNVLAVWIKIDQTASAPTPRPCIWTNFWVGSIQMFAYKMTNICICRLVWNTLVQDKSSPPD